MNAVQPIQVGSSKPAKGFSLDVSALRGVTGKVQVTPFEDRATLRIGETKVGEAWTLVPGELFRNLADLPQALLDIIQRFSPGRTLELELYRGADGSL